MTTFIWQKSRLLSLYGGNHDAGMSNGHSDSVAPSVGSTEAPTVVSFFRSLFFNLHFVTHFFSRAVQAERLIWSLWCLYVCMYVGM